MLGGYFTGGWARAFPGAAVRAESVHYVLAKGQPARVAEVRLELAEEAREVQVRLGKGTWIRCLVRHRIARCRVPAGEGDAARLERLSVFVRG